MAAVFWTSLSAVPRLRKHAACLFSASANPTLIILNIFNESSCRSRAWEALSMSYLLLDSSVAFFRLAEGTARGYGEFNAFFIAFVARLLQEFHCLGLLLEAISPSSPHL